MSENQKFMGMVSISEQTGWQTASWLDRWATSTLPFGLQGNRRSTGCSGVPETRGTYLSCQLTPRTVLPDLVRAATCRHLCYPS